MQLVKHNRTSFLFLTVFKKIFDFFIIFHCCICFHRCNRIPFFFYPILHFIDCLIIQNRINCLPFICLSINIRNKLQNHFTLILCFFSFRLIYWKVITFFPLFCNIFFCILVFFRRINISTIHQLTI